MRALPPAWFSLVCDSFLCLIYNNERFNRTHRIAYIESTWLRQCLSRASTLRCCAKLSKRECFITQFWSCWRSKNCIYCSFHSSLYSLTRWVCHPPRLRLLHWKCIKKLQIFTLLFFIQLLIICWTPFRMGFVCGRRNEMLKSRERDKMKMF